MPINNEGERGAVKQKHTYTYNETRNYLTIKYCVIIKPKIDIFSYMSLSKRSDL